MPLFIIVLPGMLPLSFRSAFQRPVWEYHLVCVWLCLLLFVDPHRCAQDEPRRSSVSTTDGSGGKSTHTHTLSLCTTDIRYRHTGYILNMHTSAFSENPRSCSVFSENPRSCSVLSEYPRSCSVFSENPRSCSVFSDYPRVCL